MRWHEGISSSGGEKFTPVYATGQLVAVQPMIDESPVLCLKSFTLNVGKRLTLTSSKLSMSKSSGTVKVSMFSVT